MLRLRKSGERGHARADWLESRHTFSFAGYHDPAHMGFRTLRVLNEDWIAPRRGFGAHPHRDMEILTWPIAGALEHRDSEGGHSVLRPGRVGLMRAGRGIVHSERNPLPDASSHLLQIWIEPDTRGLPPLHQETDLVLPPGVLVPIATPGGVGGALDLRQDATVSAARLAAGDVVTHAIGTDRHAWIQVVSGKGTAGGQGIEAGDGIAASAEERLVVSADTEMEILVFDLA